MREIINMLPILVIAVIINIMLGTYYKIGKNKLKFNCKVFIQGLIKAFIVGASFIGLAYCFDVIDLSNIGITPTTIMSTSVIMYVTKDIQNLAKVLGIETNKFK